MIVYLSTVTVIIHLETLDPVHPHYNRANMAHPSTSKQTLSYGTQSAVSNSMITRDCITCEQPFSVSTLGQEDCTACEDVTRGDAELLSLIEEVDGELDNRWKLLDAECARMEEAILVLDTAKRLNRSQLKEVFEGVLSTLEEVR